MCFDTYLLQGLVSVFNFCFLSSWKFHCLINRIQKALPLLTYAFLLVNGVDIICVFDICKLLLLLGDIELNPGPRAQNFIRFFHWNLNSICARNRIKIPFIEAYNSLHKYDIIAVSETMLDSNVGNEDISIAGFSNEIFRNDHQSNSKTGGCLHVFL